MNWLEYGARSFDLTIGRFMNIDRFSEKYESINPYQYTLNNPIRFIDVNGDYVYINDGDKTYRYENGQVQHEVDGKWTNINIKQLSSFASQALSQVKLLYSSGDAGKSLVNFFSGEGSDITIRKGGENFSQGNEVFMNLNGKSQSITTKGLTDNPFYVSLGHEMAHVQDYYTRSSGDRNKIWYGKATDSEIYATHIENLIRSDKGLPLRTHYIEGVSYTDKGKTIIGVEATRLIDKYGNSRYYDSRGNRLQPSPSVNKGVYGGEIYKNRFNYNNRPIRFKSKGLDLKF